MQYRKLGRTGLEVSAIGLGTEYLINLPQDAVTAVIHEAIDNGINYFDLFFAQPQFRDQMGAAFRGHRQRVILAAHLGAADREGQYEKIRDPRECERFFLDFLGRYHTDHADVLFLHNCDARDDYERVMGPGGLLDLARRYQREGKARFIAFSGHTAQTAQQAVESGQVDVLMFPISLAGHAVAGKMRLLQACVERDVGLVAMKPFAGGKLLQSTRVVKVEQSLSGGGEFEAERPSVITPVQCLAYALAQPGVSTVVPGCHDLAQLADALTYERASEREKDFSAIVVGFQQYVAGECVYCNHCLPCPMGVDIGQAMRLLDMAQSRLTPELRAAYAALAADASDCIQCGDCEVLCPFGVAVMARMEQAAATFG